MFYANDFYYLVFDCIAIALNAFFAVRYRKIAFLCFLYCVGFLFLADMSSKYYARYIHKQGIYNTVNKAFGDTKQDDIEHALYLVDEKDVGQDVESKLYLKLAILALKNAEVNINSVKEVVDSLRQAGVDDSSISSNRILRVAAQRAREQYEVAKTYIDSIHYDGDANFNFELNYTKGCIYFKYLQYFANQGDANEVFDKTLDSFKKALKYKEKDLNTQINIELLIRDKSQMTGAGAGSGQDDSLKKLEDSIIQGKGVGRGKY